MKVVPVNVEKYQLEHVNDYNYHYYNCHLYNDYYVKRIYRFWYNNFWNYFDLADELWNARYIKTEDVYVLLAEEYWYNSDYFIARLDGQPSTEEDLENYRKLEKYIIGRKSKDYTKEKWVSCRHKCLTDGPASQYNDDFNKVRTKMLENTGKAIVFFFPRQLKDANRYFMQYTESMQEEEAAALPRLQELNGILQTKCPKLTLNYNMFRIGKAILRCMQIVTKRYSYVYTMIGDVFLRFRCIYTTGTWNSVRPHTSRMEISNIIHYCVLC